MARDEAFREAIISVDTFHMEVARQAVAAGAHMVNDVSGGLLDPEMLPEVSGAVPDLASQVLVKGLFASVAYTPVAANIGVPCELHRWLGITWRGLRSCPLFADHARTEDGTPSVTAGCLGMLVVRSRAARIVSA